MQDEYDKAVSFMDSAIREIGGFDFPSRTKVLDFGCGKGQLINGLAQLGYDSYGCDISEFWGGDQSFISERLRMISSFPYRLPFDDNSFDVVVSQTVLEHAQNKEICFQEILRVLKPDGYSMHLYPGKWYLPYEPHIYVPLVNYFWPKCPKWWLGLWALVGVRNEFQKNMTWKEVFASNHKYCRESLSYWSTKQYRNLSLKVFGNCSWRMEFFVNNTYGRISSSLRKLPFKKLSGLLLREFRMGFMVMQKRISPTAVADLE